MTPDEEDLSRSRVSRRVSSKNLGATFDGERVGARGPDHRRAKGHVAVSEDHAGIGLGKGVAICSLSGLVGEVATKNC